eukprot:SM000130S27074  [mRNA]  locus=s130:53679:55208:+ [translate_table: standard]
MGGDHMLAKKLGDVEVRQVVGPGADDDRVKLSTFWQDQPVLLHLLRRFGCTLCRGGAADLSRAIPLLRASGVRVVGIGLEELGVGEFVANGFWGGELYIDDGKEAYRALELKKYGVLKGLYTVLFDRRTHERARETSSTPGDLKGDGMQLGATFAIDQGGAQLLDYRQTCFSDHVTPEQVLTAFGIDAALLPPKPPKPKVKAASIASTTNP